MMSMSQPASPSSREELIEQYRPYVRNIAGKIMKTLSGDVDFEDLVGYGELGLIEAADRFDPKFNVNFMTFAYYRIRGAIYDGLRGMGWISRSQYARIRYEERANTFLASVHERHSSSVDQRPLHDEVNELAEAITGLASIFITSLDANEGLQISDDAHPNAQQKLELKEAKKIIRKAIKLLPDQERTLLEYYYYKEMTLQQAGETLGLSKSWASRLHARAIQKLQKIVREMGLDETSA